MILRFDTIFQHLLNFKGFGNPTGNIWFIGSEENWDPVADDESFQYYVKDVQPFNVDDFQYNRSRFYKGLYQLFEVVAHDTRLPSSLEQFGESCFVSNLYHVGLESRQYPDRTQFELHYLRPIGIDYDTYKKSIEDRLSILRTFWQLKKGHCPQTIFCLSKTNYWQYLRLFGCATDSKHAHVPQVQKIDDDVIYFLHHPACLPKYWKLSIDFVRNTPPPRNQ